MSLKSFLLISLSTLVLAVLDTNAFGQNFEWARQIGGTAWDEGTSIKTGRDKQVYAVGLFRGTVDFDPGAGVFNMTSVGEKDAFICKLDADGNFLWAKQYGDSAGIDEKSSLEIDTSGNLYITNSFLGTVDFDPGAGSFVLTSQGMDRNIFVQKLDADGHFIWVKQIGGPFEPLFPTPSHSYDLALDNSGNVYLTGYFDGTADFDPDPSSEFNMTSHYNSSDIFICKLNPDGHFVWAKQFSGTQPNRGGVGYGIVVDSEGNVYTTGTMGGTIDFDPGPGTYHLNITDPLLTEIYLNKLDASGNFVWAKTLGPGEGSAIAIDKHNTIYSSSWTPAGYLPMLNKHDSDGNLLWAKHPGGIMGKAIALDSQGNVYTAGICFGTNDFDPGPGVFNLTGGNSDSYISKLDSLGNFLWAGLLTGTSQVNANSLTVDQDDNVYITGFFDGTANFDLSGSGFNLVCPLMGYDVFIQKLSTDGVLGLEKNGLDNMEIYPNPTKGKFFVKPDKAYDNLQLVLRNVQGQVVNTTFTTVNDGIEIQLNGESGVYLLELIGQQDYKRVVKIVKE
ncbi:Beta-propeller repeat protein [compost metagenome]